MLKKCLYTILLIGLPLLCLSQTIETGSVRDVDRRNEQLRLAKGDSSRIEAMQRLGFFYERLNVDSALKYYNAALDLARRKSYGWAEARLLASLSGEMEHQGRYAEAFELLFESLEIAEKSKSPYDIARANRRLSGVYFELQNLPKTIAYLLKALVVDKDNGYVDKVAIDHYALADAYEKMNKLDSAEYYIALAFQQKDLLKGLMQYVYEIDGHIKQKKGDYEQAVLSYRQGFEEARVSSDLIGSSQLCADVSILHRERNVYDSAILYALKGFHDAKEISYKKGIMLNGNLLAELYDSTQPSVALRYYKAAAAAKDSLYGVTSIQAVQDLVLKEEAKQKELEDAKTAYRNKLRWYGSLTGVAVLLIVAFILYRNNRQKQKANVLLQERKEKIETTLSELKAAQAQLVQSEKMASLGELTAGIAHEIQNPLNFVNNFSEVNRELIEELNAERIKPNAERNEQLENAILTDIKDNEQKINYHGKRADAIVKGMLQHSRTSGGQKELTDINALCDEYLRLAYHGLRAKDKSLNAKFETDFDFSLPKINVIPQDIGRVILNLINNAFYAVSERKKNTGSDYEPLVVVKTRATKPPLGGLGVSISVHDNGLGIPQKLMDKIFQPFFTTKPTGQGTGLGLSLAYDIVKAHGGEIKVETKEGEGSNFMIQLPVV